MCDADSLKTETMLGRRGFGALATGVTAAAMWPKAALAQAALNQRNVNISTSAGTIDAYLVAPSSGKHPAVLIWPDIRGLRPAYRLMADRLAREGYAVLVVNPFYRWQAGPALAEGEVFSDEAVRGRLFGWAGELTRPVVEADTRDIIRYLDQQDSVDTARRATIAGYCLGGPFSIFGATALPNRIGAAASFHGVSLATEEANSPHLLIPSSNAAYLFAIAEDDDAKEPQEKVRLRAVLEPRTPWHEVEVYPAKHGWCPPDGHAYDEASANKAFDRLLYLTKQTG